MTGGFPWDSFRVPQKVVSFSEATYCRVSSPVFSRLPGNRGFSGFLFLGIQQHASVRRFGGQVRPFDGGNSNAALRPLNPGLGFLRVSLPLIPIADSLSCAGRQAFFFFLFCGDGSGRTVSGEWYGFLAGEGKSCEGVPPGFFLRCRGC